jgi:hypothetical protein
MTFIIRSFCEMSLVSLCLLDTIPPPSVSAALRFGQIIDRGLRHLRNQHIKTWNVGNGTLAFLSFDAHLRLA